MENNGLCLNTWTPSLCRDWVGGGGRIAFLKPLTRSHWTSHLNINQTVTVHIIKSSGVFPLRFRWNPIFQCGLQALCHLDPSCFPSMPFSAWFVGLQPHQPHSWPWDSVLAVSLALSLESSSADCLVIHSGSCPPLQGVATLSKASLAPPTDQIFFTQYLVFFVVLTNFVFFLKLLIFFLISSHQDVSGASLSWTLLCFLYPSLCLVFKAIHGAKEWRNSF